MVHERHVFQVLGDAPGICAGGTKAEQLLRTVAEEVEAVKGLVEGVADGRDDGGHGDQRRLRAARTSEATSGESMRTESSLLWVSAPWVRLWLPRKT